jgi:hypothetical protein
MSVSHKYRTFSQLYEDVAVDFTTYSLEGLIEPQQLIKVATRINYELGLKIHRTKQTIIDVEHGRAQLPKDFAYINYAFLCGEYKINASMPSGTHVETFNDVPYVPAPGEVASCSTGTGCADVCVVQTCEDKNSYQLFEEDTYYFILFEKPIKRKNYIYLSIVIFVIVSFTLFPLWPLWMKHAIWWMLVMLIVLLVSFNVFI